MMFLKSFSHDVFEKLYVIFEPDGCVFRFLFPFHKDMPNLNSRIKENALDRFLKAKQTVSDATPAG